MKERCSCPSRGSVCPWVGRAFLGVVAAFGPAVFSPAAFAQCSHITAGNCAGQVGIEGVFEQVCVAGGSDDLTTPEANDGWHSLAFPILTGGNTIDAVSFTLNTNRAGGDLYILGHTTDPVSGLCQPDITNILAQVCCALEGLAAGVVHTIHVGDILTSAVDPTWVVFVGRTGEAGQNALGFFDGGLFPSHQVGRKTGGGSQPFQAFANLVGTGNPGDWQDLNDELPEPLGTRYCVALLTTGLPSDMIDCVTNPAPAGSCCQGDQQTPQSCVDGLRGFACGVADGIYNGDGSTCAAPGPNDIACTCGAGAGLCVDPDFDGIPNGNGTPGCFDLTCCKLICSVDPSCCAVEWDDACAVAAEPICFSPFCGVPQTGDCFVDDPGILPFCNDECDGVDCFGCCGTVCAFDPFCCQVDWDQNCADQAVPLCTPPACGVDETGDCFTDNPGVLPFCNNRCSNQPCSGCCESVCAVDPFCCDTDWDATCVAEAEATCDCAPADIPLNDDCANATVVGLGTFLYTTLCSNPDGPLHPGSPCDNGFGEGGTLGPDIWFLFTSPLCGDVRLSLCDVAPDYDTELAVYNSGTCPVTELDLIECNNDAGCVDPTASEITFAAQAGFSYLVRVGGRVALSGSGTLTILAAGPPCPWDCQAVPSCAVEVPDLLALLATWGGPGPCDFDASGAVEVPDLLALLANWGACP